MSHCVVKSWKMEAVANQRDRPTNTAASKEMEDRLAKMKAERQQQDSMWQEPSPPQAPSQQGTSQQKK